MNGRLVRIIMLAVGWMVVLGIIGYVPAAGLVADSSRQIAPTSVNGWPVAVYFFWGDGCPHCEAARAFLQDISHQYPNLEIRAYEVWYDTANQQLLWRMAGVYGFEPNAVPTIFIADRYWIGYSEPIGDEIAAVISACSANGCRDAGLGIVPGSQSPEPTLGAVVPTEASEESVDTNASNSRLGATEILSIPLVGEVNLAAQSLTLSTALIAFVDGFNPCSLWVLSVLLALTLHSGSRRKVFLVGGVFLTITSLIYMLFITGLFTMFTVVSFVGMFQVVAALAALFFAVVNIKDYFWYKKGISLTIDDSKKPGIYEGMRRVMNAGESTRALIGATIVLSAGISLVEFSCTAGFPVLWTNLLISQQVSTLTFGALLLFYMLIYQVDELIIFSLAVFTLRAGRFEEKHGRLLKLVGGMLMLTLALVMLINPAWMNKIGSSLLVFLTAFGMTLLLLVTHRYILPRFGVHIGSELALATAKKGTHRHPRRRT